MEMRMQHKSSLNSLKAERNKGEGKIEQVQIRKLDDFLREEPVVSIDFMKIDTEGFEREVLEGATETLASGKIKAIQLELGFNRRDFRTTHFNQVNDILQDFDFAVAGFYDQSPNKPGWNFLKLSNVLYLNQRTWD
jgi:predicted transcriptional regulator